MKMICLLKTGITLTWAKQIVLIDLNSNTYSRDQVEKRISLIGQSYEYTAHILVYTNVTIEQKIRTPHDKCKEMDKNDNDESLSIWLWK